LFHLRGVFIISRLENAIKPRDARDAKLIEKLNLIVLCLEWSANVDDSQDRTCELDLLKMLQPHNDLNELISSLTDGMVVHNFQLGLVIHFLVWCC
jgi:hypothetical protein